MRELRTMGIGGNALVECPGAHIASNGGARRSAGPAPHVHQGPFTNDGNRNDVCVREGGESESQESHVFLLNTGVAMGRGPAHRAALLPARRRSVRDARLDQVAALLVSWPKVSMHLRHRPLPETSTTTSSPPTSFSPARSLTSRFAPMCFAVADEQSMLRQILSGAAGSAKDHFQRRHGPGTGAFDERVGLFATRSAHALSQSELYIQSKHDFLTSTTASRGIAAPAPGGQFSILLNCP